MAELTPSLADAAVEAITANAEEAAGAIGRAFDGEFVVKAGGPVTAADTQLEGAGLVMAFDFAGEGMIATLPTSSGLVPDWVKEPDPTGESKLSTLSQELSMLLVPDTLMADVFEARWVDDLAAAVQRGGVEGDATSLPVELAQGETLGQLTMLWPAAAAMEAVNDPSSVSGSEEAAPDAAGEDAGKSQSSVIRPAKPAPRDLRDLPPNVLSALQVSVPLSVSLAGKKVPLQDVIELGPGSIITFDKSCDDPLEVAVGDQPVALGEAVKVGEYFGVRLQEMILPDEHFRPMLPPKAS